MYPLLADGKDPLVDEGTIEEGPLPVKRYE